MHSLSECEEAHQQVACAWLTNHTNVWEDFIPEQAHCSKGEFVRKEGACSAGAHPTLGRVFCLGCGLLLGCGRHRVVQRELPGLLREVPRG